MVVVRAPVPHRPECPGLHGHPDRPSQGSAFGTAMILTATGVNGAAIPAGTARRHGAPPSTCPLPFPSAWRDRLWHRLSTCSHGAICCTVFGVTAEAPAHPVRP